MNLTEILTRVVEDLHGAQMAGIVGTDGLGVEIVIADGQSMNRETAELELGELAAVATRAATQLQAGQLRDLILEGDEQTYLAAAVTPGYFAVLGIGTNGNLGRARFALRQMVERLRDVV
jgi:predicted regulator of Ras-like GTPase activity (Roadblock/LC7/MglB family)